MSRSSPSRTRSPLNAPSPPLPQPPAPASAFRLHESGSSGDRTEVESHGIPTCHRRLYGDSGWAENAELVDVFLEHFKNVTGFSSCVPTGQPSGQCAVTPSFLPGHVPCLRSSAGLRGPARVWRTSRPSRVGPSCCSNLWPDVLHHLGEMISHRVFRITCSPLPLPSRDCACLRILGVSHVVHDVSRRIFVSRRNRRGETMHSP